MGFDGDHARWHHFPRQEFPPGQSAARLESLAVIEQAKGIMMAKLGCTDLQAFVILRAVSKGRNGEVRDVAAQLIARTVGNPGPVPGPDLQGIGGRADRGQALLDLLGNFPPNPQA